MQEFNPIQPDLEQIRFAQRANELERAVGGKDSQKESSEDIRNAAREFESFFLYYLIKIMRETVQESELFGERKAEKIYQSMQDEQIAHELAEKGGIGLGEMMLKGLGVDEGLGGFERPFHVSDARTKVSSGFGPRWDPVSGEKRFHKGVDLAMPSGAPIYAAADGKVAFCGKMHGYGNVVILRHSDQLETVYAHNESNERQVGEMVRKGDLIARVGMSGKTTGPHLHFEVRSHGKPVDPQIFVKIQEVNSP